nr:ABC transporter permease [Miniphocaeibacter massiliensis]
MNDFSKKNTLLYITLKFLRSFKKNTTSLLLSFILTVGLIVSIITLIHTNHSIVEKQNLFIYSNIDYEIKDVSLEQYKKIKDNSKIKYLGVSKYLGNLETANKQQGSLVGANGNSILTVSKLNKGRLPEKPKEVVAEKWALLNLGINPVVGQKFVVPTRSDFNNSIKEVEYELVGIVNDQAFNKRAKSVNLYTYLDLNNESELILSVTFFDNVNKEKEVTNIRNDVSLDKKQIQANVWKGSSKELFKIDVQICVILIIICSTLIYGIYRIALRTRKSHYGILRAIGLTKRQIQKIILYEFGIVSLVSFPLGILLGLFISYLVTYFSKDQSIKIYFFGKLEKFELIIPIIPIVICLIFLILAIFVIGVLSGKQINKDSITETISKELEKKSLSINILMIKGKKKFISIYKQLALKYVFQDIKTTIYIIISLSLGGALFISLAYQAKLAKDEQEIKIATSFYNSDYIMNIYNDMDVSYGIKPSIVKKIEKVANVESIETQLALPVRVADSKVKRNDRYFIEHNKIVTKHYGFDLHGNDKEDEVYLSKFKGYNKEALEKLKNYLVEGNLDNLKNDEVIIAMPFTSEYGKSKGTVGFFKKGTPIMDYKVGDKISIKYPSDFKTDNEEFWNLNNDNKEYIKKDYKIAGITYYPYMPQVSLLEQTYPLIITSEKNFSEIVSSPTYESININGKRNISSKEQSKIENTLIELAVENGEVTARSIINEREQLYTIYDKELVYIIGIALVVLVLVVINFINNLKYRIETRTYEMYLLKGLGLTSKSMVKIIVLENLLFGIVSLIISGFIAIISTRILYKRSQIYLLGKSYNYPVIQFVILAICTLLLCVCLSLYLSKELKNSSIVEKLNSIDY